MGLNKLGDVKCLYVTDIVLLSRTAAGSDATLLNKDRLFEAKVSCAKAR